MQEFLQIVSVYAPVVKAGQTFNMQVDVKNIVSYALASVKVSYYTPETGEHEMIPTAGIPAGSIQQFYGDVTLNTPGVIPLTIKAYFLATDNQYYVDHELTWNITVPPANTLNPTLSITPLSVPLTGQITIGGSGYTPNSIMSVKDSNNHVYQYQVDLAGNFNSGSVQVSTITNQAGVLSFRGYDTTGVTSPSIAVTFTVSTVTLTGKIDHVTIECNGPQSPASAATVLPIGSKAKLHAFVKNTSTVGVYMKATFQMFDPAGTNINTGDTDSGTKFKTYAPNEIGDLTPDNAAINTFNIDKPGIYAATITVFFKQSLFDSWTTVDVKQLEICSAPGVSGDITDVKVFIKGIQFSIPYSGTDAIAKDTTKLSVSIRNTSLSASAYRIVANVTSTADNSLQTKTVSTSGITVGESTTVQIGDFDMPNTGQYNVDLKLYAESDVNTVVANISGIMIADVQSPAIGTGTKIPSDGVTIVGWCKQNGSFATDPVSIAVGETLAVKVAIRYTADRDDKGTIDVYLKYGPGGTNEVDAATGVVVDFPLSNVESVVYPIANIPIHGSANGGLGNGTYDIQVNLPHTSGIQSPVAHSAVTITGNAPGMLDSLPMLIEIMVVMMVVNMVQNPEPYVQAAKSVGSTIINVLPGTAGTVARAGSAVLGQVFGGKKKPSGNEEYIY